MPRILITGNGFDLSLGLPTSYNDFIRILNYIDQNDGVDFLSVYSQVQNFPQIENNFKSFELELDKIKKLRELMNKNVWFEFFKTEYQIETWIDFENKIEYVLEILFSSTVYIKKSVFSNGSLKGNKFTYPQSIFNNDIEIIEVLAKFNIIERKRNDELMLNSDFLIQKYDHYTNINLELISKSLYGELITFKKIFNYYIEIFIFPFYKSFNNKPRIHLPFITNFHRHYTFNYTPTFEKVYKKFKITNYLHGKIDSQLNDIVLGISDIPIDFENRKLFIPFTKYYQKLNNTTDFKFINEYEKKNHLSYLFVFLGHSLDRSDEGYINEVFDFVIKLNSSKSRIVIIYHNNEAKSKMLINLLDIRDKKDIEDLMKNDILMFKEIGTKELERSLRDFEMTTFKTEL